MYFISRGKQSIEVLYMVIKYDYREGYCEISKYRGLYPVKVIQKVEKGLFKKAEMACDYVLNGVCEKSTTCPLFLELIENVDIDDEWKLRDKKY